MDILKNKQTHTVQLLDNNITEDNGTWVLSNQSTLQCISDWELIQNVSTPPQDYYPLMYQYANNTWSFSLEYYNAFLQIRNQRNKLLIESDWTQMTDVVLANKSDWDTYRQALRDLPANITNPFTVEWPKDPNWVDVTF